MSKDKKRLLVVWGNPYMFYEDIVPIIPKLAQNFLVSIILVDCFMPKEVYGVLEDMFSAGLIEKYWIAPSDYDIFKLHWFMKTHLKIWRGYNFDICMSISEMQPFERYLFECVLSRDCLRVCFWSSAGYLLKNEDLAKGLLGQEVVISREVKKQPFQEKSFIKRLISKIREQKSFLDLVRLSLRVLRSYSKFIFRFFLGPLHYYMNRYILPGILAGKTFPLGEYDRLTQLGSGCSDAYVFSDDIDAKVVSKLFKKSRFFVAKYPTQENCRCNGKKNDKSAVLVPLTTTYGNIDRIPEKDLFLFYRDISTVLRGSGAGTVHLRPHPREEGRWPYYLQDFLKGKGINTLCVNNYRPIREIMCDYIGMAGPVTNSLRDGRACCDYIFVVGFVALSKYFTANPRFLFGNSEGINWIDEDGKYNPSIFKIQRYVPPQRKSIDEILLDLSRG